MLSVSGIFGFTKMAHRTAATIGLAIVMLGCESSSTPVDENKTDLASETAGVSPTATETQSAPDSLSDDSDGSDGSGSKPVRSYSGDAFRAAAHNGNIDLVREALASGVAVDIADPVQGYTALLMAAYNGHRDVVALLLDHQAEVDVRDKAGKTPLMHACSGPFTDAAGLLIQAGANVNAMEWTEGFTPLMTAAALGQPDVVKLLLKNGADRGMMDRDGDTALSHAQNAGHQQIVTLLQ